MSNEQLKALANGTAPQIKIAGALWVVGMMTVMVATIAWVAMSVWANDYYAIPKVGRDAAQAGSVILSDLASFQTAKAWVLPLQVVGLATFLLGFGFAFANILNNVRLRGDTMAAVLPVLKERKGQG